MSMIVAHNLAAMNASKNLYGSNRGLNKSLEKLSSGYRINVGADGPADLVISEQLRAQVHGIERAIRNTTEATNVLTIAEGALNEVNSILKKMKALAIHASSSGVTSPEQVAADQAEMDSSIQTIERISNVTKYSDQFLLNGSKDLTYQVDTNVKGTQNNRMINTGLTTFRQIFKRDGYAVNVGFNGAIGANALTNIGNAAMNRQASRAYLEIDAYDGTISQVDEDGYLTKGQSFILTGSLGSRQFTFSEGAHVSEIVSSIHNVAGSTGVDAALTFNRQQTINQANQAAVATGVSATNTVGNTAITIYDNYTVTAQGNHRLVANGAEINGNVVYGKNTDGNGFIYVKVIDNNGGYEVYKDASLSLESKIGSGNGAGANPTAQQLNHSGLEVLVDLAGTASYGDVIKLSVGNIALDGDNVALNGVGACRFGAQVNGVGTACAYSMHDSTAAGVQLGINTSADGKLFFKIVYGDTPGTAQVFAYRDALMREKDMVAKTYGDVDLNAIGAAAGGGSIVLDSIWNDEHTANTGLGITLAVQNIPNTLTGTSETFDMQFTNLGARIFSTEYGSDAFITCQMFEGGLFVDYEDQANYDSAKLVEAKTTFTKKGQDATITVNGQQMKTRGLELNLATPDIMADVTFNSGKTGTTTLAQVGYGEGTIFNKNTALTMAWALNDVGEAYEDTKSNRQFNQYYSALLNNACHVTQERVSDFQGGMQLQLGEGAGDQERTVLGIKSMSTAQLGRLEVTKAFDPSKAVIETKTLCIQDVMGGQLASLATDPVTAMRIIDVAIQDVAELRAQIGAVQSNMLQTNENNLRVAVENITKTESAIRDTDMASEMTEFT